MKSLKFLQPAKVLVLFMLLCGLNKNVVGQNIAVGKPITASNVWTPSTYTADMANDNKYDTYWGATPSFTDKYIKVDLQSLVSIKEIGVSLFMVTKYKIEASTDNINFTPIVLEQTPTNPNSYQRHSFSSGTYRWIRFVVLTAASPQGPTGLYEFEVFAVPPVYTFTDRIQSSGTNPLTINLNNLVGIGTANPRYTLDVNGNVNAKNYLLNGQPLANPWLTSASSNLYYNGGNVGIGTTDPKAKLEINGNLRINDGTALHKGTIVFGMDDVIIQNSPEGFNYSYGDLQFKNWNGSGYSNTLRIKGNGYVGIGTTTPDAALAVKGTIHTQEVKVDLNGAVAPDYVFETSYELPSLTEVQSYINQNKHLPEIPSAKEMEENGMNLKEMNLLLLKKVEEITLYLIDIKNENEVLKKKIAEIEYKNSH